MNKRHYFMWNLKHKYGLLKIPVYRSFWIRNSSICSKLIIRTPIVFECLWSQSRYATCTRLQKESNICMRQQLNEKLRHVTCKVKTGKKNFEVERKIIHIKEENNTASLLESLLLEDEKIPMYMQKSEKRTGIKKAGATLFIIFTPPNTTKHRRIATITP